MLKKNVEYARSHKKSPVGCRRASKTQLISTMYLGWHATEPFPMLGPQNPWIDASEVHKDFRSVDWEAQK